MYTDIGFGAPLTGASGALLNMGLNYQVNKSLFTLRLNAIGGNFPEVVYAARPRTETNLFEYAALYGLRFINGGHSYSFSAGLSFDNRVTTVSFNDVELQHFANRYPGVPFEMNVLWFKKAKRRNRIYGIIPFGKPTAYGGSYGFRLSGNLSKYSYISLGGIFGLGYFKHY